MSDASYDYENLAYGQNIFNALPRQFGIFEAGDTQRNDFNAFQSALATRNVLVSSLGFTTNASPVRNAPAHDFRPAAGSSAIDYGARSFVPWALYRPVGEWHFRRSNKSATVLLDENWYMTSQYLDRTTYYTTPRFHLTGVNIVAGDYVNGPLENWSTTALRFNGTNKYASVGGTISSLLTLDIGTNNFLLETYFATVPGHTGGVIAAKCAAAGYVVDINPHGCARLALRVGGNTVFTRASATVVNDGQWHHVITEYNRANAMIKMYVDGVYANGEVSGTPVMSSTWLTNAAPFTVGKGPEGNYFNGTIDYLRVARGTLADAHTSIDELYEWEFNGPAFKDFRGIHAYGTHDAGAYEFDAGSLLPRIVLQPSSVESEPGGAVKMRVRTENATSRQWRKDTVVITGATNDDYAIAAAQPLNAGVYDVVVSNAAGGVVSTPATLTVLPEPVAVILMLPALAMALLRVGRR
jgi:hypothetical protein